MIRLLTRAGAILAALLLPAAVLPYIALAAYNNVTLTSSAIYTVGGVSLTISGSDAQVSSTTVYSGNTFDVTLVQGSSFTITSADRRNLTVTGAPNADKYHFNCGTAVSTLTLDSSPTVTITDTVTVETTTCATGGGGGGGIASSGGGGGGGGGSIYVPPVTTPAPTLPQAAVQATANNPVAVAAHYAALKRALKKGNTGADVKVLQQMLNQDSDTRISASGAGSIGKETTLFGPATLAAIKKFQVKWNIAKPGEDGYGNLGPKTRAKLNALYGK